MEETNWESYAAGYERAVQTILVPKQRDTSSVSIWIAYFLGALVMWLYFKFGESK